MSKYTVELKTGVSYAKPVINKFSSGFDSLELLLDSDSRFDDCTFAVVYSLCGETAMDIENGGKLTKTISDDQKQINLNWFPGTEVTADSGIVIYQVVAYKTNGDGGIEAVWYSPQGRIAVSESVDTTEYEAIQIGSQPSLVAQMLANISDANSKINGIEHNVESISQSVASNFKNIVSIENELSELSDEIAEADYDIGVVSERVNTNSADIEENTNKIDEVFSRVASKVDKIEGMGLCEENFSAEKSAQLQRLNGFFKSVPEGKSIDDLINITDCGHYLISDDIAPYILSVLPFVESDDEAQLDIHTVCHIRILPGDTIYNGTSVFEIRHYNGSWSFWEPYLASKAETDLALGGKVDKEEGKQLSTEDYTTSDKIKLSLLPSNFRELPVDTDFNDVTEPGVYLGSEQQEWNGYQYTMPYLLMVSNHQNYGGVSDYATVCQIKLCCGDSSSDSPVNIIQWRAYLNYSWTEWKSATDDIIDVELFQTVDQEYNPESENAQSGVAVAQAIGDIETALDGIIEVQNSLIGGDDV